MKTYVRMNSRIIIAFLETFYFYHFVYLVIVCFLIVLTFHNGF